MALIADDFMLQNEYAKLLYAKYAKDEPIFDFHCHLEAEEIYKNQSFKNITQVWLGGDHYKWRAMRAMGFDEKYITGNASDYEKFTAWAKTVPNLIGNPLYHWTHLELKRYFDIDEVLNEKTADSIWNTCNELLQTDAFKPRSLIERSNVWAVCTTNDPIDDLQYHKLLEEDTSFKTIVKPAFRPDKVLSIEKDSFKDYLADLSKASGIRIASFSDLKNALVQRIRYFDENGCKASDHGMDYLPYKKASENEIETVFTKVLASEPLTKEEQDSYKTALLIFLANEYEKRDWVMELHIQTLRNNSKKLFRAIGPDVGNDGINDHSYAENLANILSCMEEKGLPRTILFSLNPKDYYVLSTVGGSFQGGEEGIAKMQLGTSWWFLDHKDGMIEQMKRFAQTSVFSKFIGMLTDSRSFLSYPRHEYFRRILCNLIGEYVELGEYPWDEAFLGQMVKNISFTNAKNYIKIS
ncbi:glucuronate isomerase [Treponema phagedenis]|uniref:Uronate isomerase n=1 Tax=Treponema phagedenis TaxID=162 RepID=A0A0B7H3E9_TREPH|nr:glucuronate isomerase [Treponema phagedenis]NVP23911.1 glucuronate isomerase [Treponema phagedenis]QEJ93824.1 glucuronate isomerase [Treponema phagedenis]QEJ96582.1 glucuronate isomerase [Treponema phagedenis]QEJ99749.1 glucuronate isomerase [Treponema phagedenis]QEK02368.1 glucuronate isomerase [Treponema phagedenis]